jgi:hypothetical protein
MLGPLQGLKKKIAIFAAVPFEKLRKDLPTYLIHHSNRCFLCQLGIPPFGELTAYSNAARHFYLQT